MECLDGYEPDGCEPGGYEPDGYEPDRQGGVVGVVYYANPEPENVMGYGGGGGCAASAGELGGLQGDGGGGFVLRSVGTPDAGMGVLLQ